MSLRPSRSSGSSRSPYRLNLAPDRDRAKKEFLARYGLAILRSSGRQIQDFPVKWRRVDSQWYLEVEFASEQMRRDFPFLRSRQEKAARFTTATGSADLVPPKLRRVSWDLQGGVPCPRCRAYLGGKLGIRKCPYCDLSFEVTE